MESPTPLLRVTVVECRRNFVSIFSFLTAWPQSLLIWLACGSYVLAGVWHLAVMQVSLSSFGVMIVTFVLKDGGQSADPWSKLYIFTILPYSFPKKLQN